MGGDFWSGGCGPGEGIGVAEGGYWGRGGSDMADAPVGLRKRCCGLGLCGIVGDWIRSGGESVVRDSKW